MEGYPNRHCNITLENIKTTLNKCRGRLIKTIICYDPCNLRRHNKSVVIGKPKISLKGAFQRRFSPINQPTFNVSCPQSVIVKLLTTSPKKRHRNLYTYDDRRLDDTWKTVIEHLR